MVTPHLFQLALLCLCWLLLQTLFLLALLPWIAFFEGMLLGVPFSPTLRQAIPVMIEFAELRKDTVVYDLGSGDGRIVFAAAEKSDRVTGIEGSVVMFLASTLLQKILKKNGRIVRGNLFHQDLRDADVIFCFLNPSFMSRLEKKFRTELKEGARIVAFSTPMAGWEAEKTQILENTTKRPSPVVYLYRVRKAQG